MQFQFQVGITSSRFVIIKKRQETKMLKTILYYHLKQLYSLSFKQFFCPCAAAPEPDSLVKRHQYTGKGC